MDENKRDLIKLIQLNFSHLSKGQRLIAEYIISNYDKAAFMTASKLGEMVGVSESTVVRFANALGFSGYPELQKSLQELIKNKLTTVQRLGMEDFSDKENFIKKVVRADINNMRTTLDNLDNDTFYNVIDEISNAKRVYVLGLRSSTALAGYLGFYLSLILDNVKVVSFGMSDIFEQLLRVTKDDVVIGISYPRYSKKTLDALQYVKKQGCTIIGISDGNLSPISKISDYTLEAKSNMVSFVDSLVAPMSLINALIIALGIKNKNEVSTYFSKLESIWDEYNIYDDKNKSDIIDYDL
ncbi:MurR/RpiR family transcriptional regulator [Clostridium sp. D2Q-11]|uniref:MurR/RpiR family transcriptional regulator n=1 Tax=Anaeromonas frigoriresistens TaxID=2683708 RepID=A0A942ZAN3_9FIRM|nr:MurR/RpiR family transcriptional regulator [Anaeromonas frigoriresistens]MBS4539945.1 MurR/RpiR family transcriptional regulator [Anaeromonas frigoriresistens]